MCTELKQSVYCSVKFHLALTGISTSAITDGVLMEKVGYFGRDIIKEVSIKHSIIKLCLIKASWDTKHRNACES